LSAPVRIKFASYNIHKAVGLDRRRDPERIFAVLREIDADIIALQEVDRRYGRRESVLPIAAIEHSHYRAVRLQMRPDSLGWHGNALLVRRGLDVGEASAIPLPTLEPRGAVRADVLVEGRRIRVVGMHLDLSGLRRRHQVRGVLANLEECDPVPTVIMGDTNEWARSGGCFREFDAQWSVLCPGRSFPSRRPLANLDRIVASRTWQLAETKVHRSALSVLASDHLPVWAALDLP
jgi:endonuclease/exonuclease/phosphatase family metal-dependent hydrolase